MTKEPEDRLFERWCRRGDARALGELFDATARRLLKLAIHLVGDASEAEDLVQATFLAALEQRTSVDPTRPVMPWLTSVLAHKAQQHRRRAARVPEVARLEPPAVEDPSRPLERRELDDEVARALDALPEPYRAVLVLRVRHGMELADIAHALELDPGTVRVQLHRGLERLRARLPERRVSALFALELASRGLDAIRALVVERAAASTAGASATLVAGGSIVSKKILVSAAAGLVLLAFFLWRGSAPDRARVPAQAAGPVSVAAPAPPAPSSTSAAAPARSGAATGEREPAASSAAVLRGRVVDAETKDPIAGASLRLFAPREVSALELVREQPELYEVEADGELLARTRADWPLLVAPSAAARFGREPLQVFGRPLARERPVASARSARDGSFSIELGEAGGVLEGSSPGYAARWRPARTRAEPLTLELWRERDVHGVVLGPDEMPVSEPLDLVLIGARSRPRAPAVAAETSASAPRRLVPYEKPESEGLGAWVARTDDRGRFHARVGAPTVIATILTPGWGRPSDGFQSSDGDELTVRCVRVPSFHFHDAASGAPVERVRLLGRELANRYVRWSGEFLAPAGRLEVPGDWFYVQSHGKTTLAFVAWSDGYAPAQVSLADIESAATIEVPLEPGATPALEGVVWRAGAPVAGAEVALLGLSPLQWSVDEDSFVDATTTSADGRFRLSAASGTYLLRVREDLAPFLERVRHADQEGTYLTRPIAGREPYFQTVDLPGGAVLAVDLGRSGTIEVEIVDTLGNPRVEHVVALRGGDGRQALAHTDALGLARFRNLPAGRFRLHTPLAMTGQGFSFGGGEVREVELAAASVERLRIELPADTGPRHARLAARGVGDYTGWRTRTSGDPWHEVGRDGVLGEELRADGLELEVLAPDGRRWFPSIPSDAPDGFVIELEAGTGLYRGRLEHPDGTPWRGVAVHAVPWSAEGVRTRVSDVTDAAGEFELPGLASVEYRLMFQTEIERSPWDEWNNALAGVSFLPSAPPGEAGTWLAVRIARPDGEVRLHGVVERSGRPLVDATLVFACDVDGADGALRLGANRSHARTDERGAFDVQLPRTTRLTVQVYETWTKDGLVLTQELAPPRDDEALRLLVP